MSEKKKVISVMIPTYNEEENARPSYEAVRDEIRKDCPDYDYEILFIDNKSQDHTRQIITDICAQDPKVKAIFNSKNFGQFNSPPQTRKVQLAPCHSPLTKKVSSRLASRRAMPLRLPPSGIYT